MAYAPYRAWAPGSLMLFGEHAVLQGEPAMVAAVDSWVSATLQPRKDEQILLHSDQFASVQTRLSDLKIESPYHFVLAVIQHYLKELSQGFELSIEAEFPPIVGLGSSAAVTVASLAVISRWLNKKITPQELALTARRIIRQQQGMASGADVMASVYGGVVYYEMEPMVVQQLPLLPVITLVYAGYKTKTAEVVQRVQQAAAQAPQQFQQYYAAMGQCCRQAKRLIEQEQWLPLGALMAEHQQYQQLLGTSDQTLDAIIQALLQQSEVLGAKISGSGLGDGVIALGTVNSDFTQALQSLPGARLIPVNLTQQGVWIDERH